MIEIKKLTKKLAKELSFMKKAESPTNRNSQLGDPKAKDRDGRLNSRQTNVTSEDESRQGSEGKQVFKVPSVSSGVRLEEYVATPVGLIPKKYWKQVCEKCNIGYPLGNKNPKALDWYMISDEYHQYVKYRTELRIPEKSRSKAGKVRGLTVMVEQAVLKQYMNDFKGDDRFEFFLQDKFPTTRSAGIAAMKDALGSSAFGAKEDTRVHMRKAPEKKDKIIGVVGVKKSQVDEIFKNKKNKTMFTNPL